MLPSLRQLQYLVLLAEHGAFGKAAQAARVTQPTLSAGMKELEATLGVRLVDRARGKLILTAAGEAVLAQAGPILRQVEELTETARGSAAPLSGRLRLGVIPTIAPFLLPAVLPKLRARFPKLRLFLREDLTHRLIADLKSGALDAALIALPYDMDGLAWAEISDDELLAATPADHPLAREERINPASLDPAELILLEDGHCLRGHAMAACGLEPPKGGTESFAATSLPTLVQMVGSGLGVSFLPAMAVKAGLARAASVAVRPIAADNPSRKIVIAWRAGSSRASEGRLLADMLKA